MQPRDISTLVVGPAGHAAQRVPAAPQLSAAEVAPLREIAAVDETGAVRSLQLPIERPLTIAVDGREVVTLMTLGGAPEWLVLGYLRNQRLIEAVTAVQSVDVDWTQCTARVTLRPGTGSGGPGGPDGPEAPGGRGPAPLGCALGTVFGELMRRSGVPEGVEGDGRGAAPDQQRSTPLVSPAQILAILETMRRHDAIHRAAGSVHSCALFQGDELFVAVEDVSRHNGIDTVTGFMALHGIAGADKILFSTGRLTGEMVMKAAHNGVPVMISRNGTTAMGYALAAKRGMTLIGRAANRRYVCYVGAERIIGAAAPGGHADGPAS